MHRPRALLGLTVAAASASLAACSSSGPEATPPAASAPPATPTMARLPYHYQTLGESSSPTFHVDKAGDYTVAYVLTGTAQQPGCVVSIVMVGPDGSQQPVVNGEKLNPPDTRQKTVPVTLTAGDWRFQEGGGCSWNVTVSAAA
jgi:predicted small lipoprotein YifL